MRRIVFALVAVVALAGMVAYMAPASGQAKKGTRDDLAGKLARREVQRSPLSIAGREMVQVETLIPAGVESGWHVHPGEEIGYILEGRSNEGQGRATEYTLKAGEALFIPAGTIHAAKNVGSGNGAELATYIVEKGKPLVVPAK